MRWMHDKVKTDISGGVYEREAALRQTALPLYYSTQAFMALLFFDLPRNSLNKYHICSAM